MAQHVQNALFLLLHALHEPLVAQSPSYIIAHPIDATAYFMQPPDETEHTLNVWHTKAADYLTALARSDEFAGAVMVPEAADSMPAQTILSVARLQSVDLIVMASHAARGFQHWAYGSIGRL